MLKDLFSGFQYKRIALGIAIFFMGHPLIFFFRDGLKLAPQSSIFTAACLALGLLLMIPSTLFQRYFSLNSKIAVPLGAWMGVCLFYLFLFNPSAADPSYSRMRELINYGMAGAFAFLLISAPDKVKEHAMPVFVLVTFLGNLGLFYSLITNPHYVLGARASIYFDDDYGGNPHIFARNGFAGVICCLILLFSSNNILYKLLSIVNLFASLATVLLTQSRGTLMALVLAMGAFVVFGLTKSNVKAIKTALKRPSTLLFFFGPFVAVGYYLSTKPQLLGLMGAYFEQFLAKLMDALVTAGQGSDTDEIVDYSAYNRVVSFSLFQKMLFENPIGLITGSGYKYMYMDFPILEAAFNYGFVGFYFFARLIYEIVRESILAIRKMTSPLGTYLAYLFIPIFVSVFSAGQPTDTTFLFPFLMFARFMQTEKEEKEEKAAVAAAAQPEPLPVS